MKILRTANLGSNFTGSYYNKKSGSELGSQLARQVGIRYIGSCLSPGQQLLIKLTSYSEKATKNYYHYCLLVRPNFFSVFNNMLSYLSFLQQLQFLEEQGPNQPLRRFTSLISIFFALTSQLTASLGTLSFHITHSIYCRRGSLGFSFWFSVGFPRIFYLIKKVIQGIFQKLILNILMSYMNYTMIIHLLQKNLLLLMICFQTIVKVLLVNMI